MRRWYLPAGFVVGIVVIAAAAGSYIAAKPTGTMYTDPGRRFSINLAPDVVVQDLPSDNGVETLTAERGPDEYVQITIVAWPQGVALGTGALAHGYPTLVGVSVEPIAVSGVGGFAFKNSNAKQSEVLFVSKGYFYQLVGWGNSDALLGDVTAGWKFY